MKQLIPPLLFLICIGIMVVLWVLFPEPKFVSFPVNLVGILFIIGGLSAIVSSAKLFRKKDTQIHTFKTVIVFCISAFLIQPLKKKIWRKSLERLDSGLKAGQPTPMLSLSTADPQSSKIPCGDLLKRYAQKPPKLKFISCSLGNSGQVKLTAEYRVKGKYSWEVEEFLVEHYGMGKLKWVCCGWENQGRYGSFEHPKITQENPYYVASISMYGSHEYEEKKDIYIPEMDRNKVPYFVVIVEIVEV